MQDPIVTFVVPCYRLAHLLPECVTSILSQTYGDFEVLVMDDCSPDNTPEVARSFGDPRVIHVRNDPNLGHLRNYNRGIELARGKYCWLISADDRLRRPYVLERYVGVLEENPRVGYAICAGVGLRDGVETSVLDYSVHGRSDRIFTGHSFLKRLLQENTVLAAAGLVRKECYERHGAFPLNMPFAGDWYLWCLFALYCDVAYFAEPMVCYREHTLSMTTRLTQEQADACWREEVEIFWDLKRRSDAAGRPAVARDCLRGLAEVYAKNVVVNRFGLPAPLMTLDRFEESLAAHSPVEGERAWVRARVYAAIGNKHFWQGDSAAAARFWGKALAIDPWMPDVLTKRALLALGRPGRFLRGLIRPHRR